MPGGGAKVLGPWVQGPLCVSLGSYFRAQIPDHRDEAPVSPGFVLGHHDLALMARWECLWSALGLKSRCKEALKARRGPLETFQPSASGGHGAGVAGSACSSLCSLRKAYVTRSSFKLTFFSASYLWQLVCTGRSESWGTTQSQELGWCLLARG